MSMSCPIDTGQSSCIQLAHGGGGRKMRELIENSIYKYLAEENAERHHDAALVKGSDKMLLTTDSYVVNPLFFPGGDIGQLAVYGTVNDLCMAGAAPRYLTLSFIIEEGLPLLDFEKILLSIATAARECNVSIVTGDTKVVERGNCDKLFINTAGVGKKGEHSIHPRQIQSGDSIILNGDLGRHGVAIMAVRDQVECEVRSDIASLLPATASLLRSCKTIKCMRDLTRGGLVSALNELAEYCQLGISIDQEKIPKHPEVESYCEILGLDSAYVACEGRFITIVDRAEEKSALSCLREHYPDAAIIGNFVDDMAGQVWSTLPWGGKRSLPMISGELLPRIC